MSTLPSFSSVPGMAVPGNIQPGDAGQSSSGTLYEYLGQEACTYLDYLDLGTGRVLSPVPGNFYAMMVASGRNAFLTVPPAGRPWNPGNPGTGGTFAPLIMRVIIPLEISHGHYPGAACGHCDPAVRDRPPPPRRMPGPDFAPAGQPARPELPLAVSHGHYPGATCGHCDPGAPLRPPLPRRAEGPDFAPVMQQRPGLPLAVSHGHYGDAGCGHCNPAVRDAVPPPRRMDGPDVAPGEDYATVMARGRAHTSALHAAWARGTLKPGGEGED